MRSDGSNGLAAPAPGDQSYVSRAEIIGRALRQARLQLGTEGRHPVGPVAQHIIDELVRTLYYGLILCNRWRIS